MTEKAKTKTALITGASAGIGHALAFVYAQNGFDLVLTARRKDRLEKLAQTLAGATTHIYPADLCDPATPQKLYDQTKKDGVQVDVLINNAGYEFPGDFDASPWEDEALMIQAMTTAPVHLCRLFGPEMAERGFGRIINVASLAGLLPGAPEGALYGGTKAFLIKFSESLSLEYKSRGVHVLALCPGFTRSEFHKAAGIEDRVQQFPDMLWMSSEAVAQDAYKASEKGIPVFVNGRINRFTARVARFAPQRWFHRWMGNLRATPKEKQA